MILTVIWKSLVHFLDLHNAKEIHLRFYAFSLVRMQPKGIFFFLDRYCIAVWKRLCNGVTELIDNVLEWGSSRTILDHYNSSPLTFCIRYWLALLRSFEPEECGLLHRR